MRIELNVKLRWCAVCGKWVKSISKNNDFYCPNCGTQTPHIDKKTESDKIK